MIFECFPVEKVIEREREKRTKKEIVKEIEKKKNQKLGDGKRIQEEGKDLKKEKKKKNK